MQYQAAQLVFGGEEPVVTAAGQLGEDGCDESASITLTYSAGRTATLLTHSRVKLPNEVCGQNIKSNRTSCKLNVHSL